MSRVIVLGLVIIIVIVVVLIVYSCCVVSGRNSRQEELELIHKTSGLSNLENMTLENLLKAYEEDGVNFVINDGKVVDYETNECD